MSKLIVTDRNRQTREVDGRAGISLMENIRELEASVDAICGGMCACATCHIYVDTDWQGRLPARSYEELTMLQDSPHFDAARSRLSCQITFRDELHGLRFTVAPEE